MLVNFFLVLKQDLFKGVSALTSVFKDRMCGKVHTDRSFIEISVYGTDLALVYSFFFLFVVLLTTCKLRNVSEIVILYEVIIY